MRTTTENNLKKSLLSCMRRIRTEHFSSETVREARTKINSNQERFNSSNEFMHIMWTAFFLGAICQDNKFVRLKQFQKLVLRASSRFQTLETTTSTRPFHLSGNLWWNTNYEGFLKHYLIVICCLKSGVGFSSLKSVNNRLTCHSRFGKHGT